MKKRTLIIVISSAILLLIISTLIFSKSFSPGQILLKAPLYGRGFKGLMLQFSTDDVRNIAKNKKMAESFLPQLIIEADQMNVDSILIQAVQQTNTFLIWSNSRRYGYVWNKEKDGKWRFHQINNKKSSHSSNQVIKNINNTDRFVGKWKLSINIMNGIKSPELGNLLVVINKSGDKYTVTELYTNEVLTATLTNGYLKYIDNGVINTFMPTKQRNVLNLHIENEKAVWDVVCVRVE
jgi:hypothetical protein